MYSSTSKENISRLLHGLHSNGIHSHLVSFCNVHLPIIRNICIAHCETLWFSEFPIHVAEESAENALLFPNRRRYKLL